MRGANSNFTQKEGQMIAKHASYEVWIGQFGTSKPETLHCIFFMYLEYNFAP
jgi:hypothetical protein